MSNLLSIVFKELRIPFDSRLLQRISELLLCRPPLHVNFIIRLVKVKSTSHLGTQSRTLERAIVLIVELETFASGV